MMNDHKKALPDVKNRLFSAWSMLSESDKENLMLRLVQERDPFRQSLLETFLLLPPEELLMAYEDGFKASSWRLMALIVQAMPDGILPRSEQRIAMCNELNMAFTADEGTSEEEFDLNFIDIYPRQYALEKLTCNRSDCHVGALFEQAKIFTSMYQSVKPHYNHIGFYAAKMADLKSKGKEADVIQIAIDATRNQDCGDIEFATDMDSYFYGFDLISDNTGFAELISFLVHEETTIHFMADLFISTPLYFEYGGDKLRYLILKLMQQHGPEKIVSAIKSKFKSMDPERRFYLVYNITSVFDISDPICQEEDMSPILFSLCQMQIDNVNDFCRVSGSLELVFDFITKKSFCIGLYTAKSTIEHFTSVACNIIDTHIKSTGNIVSFADKINRVIHLAITETKCPENNSYEIAGLATRCLVLSGMQYPEILKELDRDSAQYVFYQMDELGLEVDTRLMMKINAMSKEDALERELGL